MKEPTADKDGIMTYTCMACVAIREGSIPTTGGTGIPFIQETVAERAVPEVPEILNPVALPRPVCRPMDRPRRK